MDEKMEFLKSLDEGTITAELFAFFDCDDIEVDSMGDFIEKFADYIMDDFSYGDC